MKLKMLVGVFGVLAVLVLGLFLFLNRCEQPTEMKVLMTQLACAQEVITPELRVDACRELKREDDCTFTDEDRPAIMALVSRRVNDCAKERLKEQNYCTDTVKDL